MKRVIMFIIGMVVAIPMFAQTEFRGITYQEALDAAKSENKRIFIDFYTQWCGPCKAMMKNVFPTREAGEYFNANFICLKLDAEAEGEELANKLGVTAYPTFFVLDSSGKVIFKKVGGESTASAFVATIKQGLDAEFTPERMAERYASGERNAELIETYTTILLKEAYRSREPENKKVALANEIIDEYFNSLSDEARLLPENLFVYGDAYLQSIDDPKAEFMMVNFDKFADEDRAIIKTNIESLLDFVLTKYYRGNIQYVHEEFEFLKGKIAEFGFSENKGYASLYRVVESLAVGKVKSFLKVCGKELQSLTPTQRERLLLAFENIFAESEKEDIVAVCKFMREHLQYLEPSSMYFVAMSIKELEKSIEEK